MKEFRPAGPARVRSALVALLAFVVSASLTAAVPVAMRRASAPAGEARSAVAEPGTVVSLAGALPTPAAPGDAPFTIDVPPGWSGGEVAEFVDDAERSFLYTDAEGRYFVVNLDPAGSGFDADQVWRYQVNGGRFTVHHVEECRDGEPMCSRGDGTLTIFAVWNKGGSATIGGHAYYFRFGHLADESSDTGIYRRILESVRVRSA